ncbi:cation ABC transporter substrate-binding protein [Lichenibacterium minor]|uniref:Cation ABC transporter substrate-binding protein n=1 Tax=Lichenibacterium minor TaxID=2316528 RepID=A0A4Q2U9J4_9HYPH|nr:zinc ABC transporter substrate-binding protein [Lichenibacterium minor]RYC31565.1 cation ABC transporter substrate-binding protein [Lichenibacterium minor]
MSLKSALLGVFAVFALPAAASAAGIDVVAAENFYGDLAKQVGGRYVSVTSILSNPDQDPHLFEADPSTARALKTARVVIQNGADYDPWMGKLLKADPSPGRAEIVAADLVGKHAGDNPHLWYDPATMQAVARDLAAKLGAIDPAHKADFDGNAAAFAASIGSLDAKVAAMKARYAGQPVTASEPVFGYMASLLGLDMHDESFQMAVMNNTEPSASDVARFEDDLKGHKVKAMIYNGQADDKAVKRLVGIARESHVPVVAVTETEPAGTTYQSWMTKQLDALDHALSAKSS